MRLSLRPGRVRIAHDHAVGVAREVGRGVGDHDRSHCPSGVGEDVRETTLFT